MRLYLSPHFQGHGARSRTGSSTCSVPHTIRKNSAPAAARGSPAGSTRAQNANPHSAPYPQWVHVARMSRALPFTSRTPNGRSSLAVARPGTTLAGRPTHCISVVLDSVMETVPNTAARIARSIISYLPSTGPPSGPPGMGNAGWTSGCPGLSRMRQTPAAGLEMARRCRLVSCRRPSGRRGKQELHDVHPPRASASSSRITRRHRWAGNCVRHFRPTIWRSRRWNSAREKQDRQSDRCPATSAAARGSISPSRYRSSSSSTSSHVISDKASPPHDVPQLLLQGLPSPVQPRHHGPRGDARDLGDLPVAEALHVGEQHGDAERLRQRCQRSLDVLVGQRFERRVLGRRLQPLLGQPRVEVPVLHLLHRHRPGLPLPPAVLVDEGVREDPEQAGPDARAGPELMEGPEGPQERLLHQVLRVGAVPGETDGARIQAIDEGERFLLEPP